MVKHLPYKYRDFSYIAAEAAMAARDQGKFREMHALLLDRSPVLDRASLIRYARELSLDVPRFTRDLDSLAHRNAIDRDLKLAETLDLYTTPTLFINGLKVVGDRPVESLRTIVNGELAGAGTGGRKK